MHVLPSSQRGAVTVCPLARCCQPQARAASQSGTRPRASPCRQGTMEPVTTQAASAPQAGDVLELTAGEVVHGGWCVSRQDDTGWVIFIRHALPGERVLATVTQ